MPSRLWLCLVAAAFALTTVSGCNCGNSRIIDALDGGNPYERFAPSKGFAAGATSSKSQNFRIVTETNAPAGSSSHSQNFQLKGGVVEASQK